MMSHSRSQGTEVTIVTGDVFPTDDDYVDGAKDVRTSSSARAPPTEMVERTRKNTIFSFHLKKINCSFQTRRSSHFNSSFEAVYGKCPERIIVM